MKSNPVWFTGIFFAAALMLAACTLTPEDILSGASGLDNGVDPLSRLSESNLNIPVLLIHGAGDAPSVWAEELAEKAPSLIVDWSVEAEQRMKAPARGYAIGVELGAALMQEWSENPPERYLMVAHSAGAWVAQGIADQIAADTSDTEPPELTIHFLDPFTAFALFQPSAGEKLLGRNAAEVKTWYTTIDPIPFTAGAVCCGDRISVDDQIVPLEDSVEAHWAVIDFYSELFATAQGVMTRGLTVQQKKSLQAEKLISYYIGE